jgi:hypothetical protein
VVGPPIDRHFGWAGLLAGVSGLGLGVISLVLGVWAGWDITRLWLWLLLSALLVLVGLQLTIGWVLTRVLEGLSDRDRRVDAELGPGAGDLAPI